MKQRIINTMVCLALTTTMHAQGVLTLTFGSVINNMRIYNDTLFVATCASLQTYDLGSGEQSEGDALCVVLYDYLRNGTRSMSIYADGVTYQQHPLNSDFIYRGERHPDKNLMGYTLSRSADFGQTWWTTGLEKRQFPGRPHIAFNPMNADEMYIFGTDEFVNCICPWVIHTTDGMQTLHSVDLQMEEDREMTVFMQMAFSPTEPGLLLMATTSGMARSTDGGVTWHYTTDDGRLFTDVCFDDLQSGVAYALEDTPQPLCDPQMHYALLRSTDSGQTWTQLTELAVPMFHTGTTTGLRGLQCYKGRLFCWADDHVYIVDVQPERAMMPTGVGALRLSSGREAFDLLGRRASAVKGIVVGNGRKYFVK